MIKELHFMIELLEQIENKNRDLRKIYSDLEIEFDRLVKELEELK